MIQSFTLMQIPSRSTVVIQVFFVDSISISRWKICCASSDFSRLLRQIQAKFELVVCETRAKQSVKSSRTILYVVSGQCTWFPILRSFQILFHVGRLKVQFFSSLASFCSRNFVDLFSRWKIGDTRDDEDFKSWVRTSQLEKKKQEGSRWWWWKQVFGDLPHHQLVDGGNLHFDIEHQFVQYLAHEQSD